MAKIQEEGEEGRNKAMIMTLWPSVKRQKIISAYIIEICLTAFGASLRTRWQAVQIMTSIIYGFPYSL
jgi:hypothetical protein